MIYTNQHHLFMKGTLIKYNEDTNSKTSKNKLQVTFEFLCEIITKCLI